MPTPVPARPPLPIGPPRRDNPAAANAPKET